MPRDRHLFDCSEQYLERRERAQQFLRDALAHCGIESDAMRGSWRHDDFHLSPDGRVSFSDLDLVLPGATDVEIADLRMAIHRALSPALQIPVSIHPVESMRDLSVGDARLLVIGEYVISIFRKVTSGRMSADYARAKVSLLFLRATRGERYRDVARRIDDDTVTRAVRVKLGTADDFSVDDLRDCLQGQQDATIQRFVAQCVLRSPGPEFMRAWEEEVLAASSVTTWLKEFLIARSLECMPR